jgi:hydroxyacylglutathione hydrolase
MRSLTIPECQTRMDSGEVFCLIDLRSPIDFAEGHVPGSIALPSGDAVTSWPVEVLPAEGRFLLLGDAASVHRFLEGVDAGLRERLDAVVEGGLEAWAGAGRPVDMLVTIAADELAMDLPHDDRILLLDLRPEAEYDEGHVRDAVSMPLASLTDPGSMAILEDDSNIYVYGKDAAEAVTAASLIKGQGYHNLRALEDGWEQIRGQRGIRMEKTASRLN